MRRLLFAIILSILPAATQAATLYSNDFTNGTQPPAGWTNQYEDGTVSFTCDSTTFPGESVGHIAIGGVEQPALYTTLDASAAWTDQVIDFTIKGRSYWTIFSVIARFNLDRFSYYSADFDIPNGTASISRSGNPEDTATFELQDGDHVVFSVTGSGNVVCTLTVNSVQLCTFTDTGGVYESGNFGFGLVEQQSWGSADFYIEDIVVTAPAAAVSEATSPAGKVGFRQFKNFKSFKNLGGE